MNTIVLLLIGVMLGGVLGVGGAALWQRSRTIPWGTPDWLLSNTESVEGISFALCETVHVLSGRQCMIVVRDPMSQIASVVAISPGVDRRYLRTAIAPTCVAGRASMGGMVVTGTGLEDLIGHALPDRRGRREEQGLAFPLRNGGISVGAIVVLGPPEFADPSTKDRLIALARDAGPLIGQVATAHADRRIEITDDIVGLRNRTGLQKLLAKHANETCSLLCAVIEDFERIDEEFGSRGTEAVLRHVATVFRNSLRDYDVPARIDEEKLAVLLPDTAAQDAAKVAERLKTGVQRSMFQWGGGAHSLSCSMGIASMPDTVAKATGLLEAAEAALRTNREKGGNGSPDTPLPNGGLGLGA